MITRMRSSALRLVLAVAGVVVLAAAPARAQRAVFLVRHAEKVDESEDAALSAEGRARAERLCRHLVSAGVGAVVTSPFQRTRDTGRPLARALGLDLRQVPALAYDQLAQILRRDYGDDVVLVVGHSNTLPGILAALGCEGEVTVDGYDDLFVVLPRADGPPTVLRLKY